MNATATDQGITYEPGGLLDFNRCRFPERLANGSHELWLKLGVLTGRLARGGVSGYVSSELPESSWKTPRELPAEALRRVIEQVVVNQGRDGRRFCLDAPEDMNIFDQLDTHFSRGIRRKERSG